MILFFLMLKEMLLYMDLGMKRGCMIMCEQENIILIGLLVLKEYCLSVVIVVILDSCWNYIGVIGMLIWMNRCFFCCLIYLWIDWN